jgi:hypothetical protein
LCYKICAQYIYISLIHWQYVDREKAQERVEHVVLEDGARFLVVLEKVLDGHAGIMI